MVDLFEQIEEVVEFSEASNTPIQGGKVLNIAYLLILIIGGTENTVNSGKTCRLAYEPGRLSRKISHKPTGTIISERRQHLWPMGTGR